MQFLKWWWGMVVRFGECDKYLGGVGFQVNGHNHEGWVIIKLTYMDEYEISFINRDRKLVKIVEGV